MASSPETALVTGASRGIGLAVARLLARRGTRVVMVARGAVDLQKAASEVGGRAVSSDAADPALPARVVELLGDAPDVLLNATGAFQLAPVADTSMDAFDQIISANLRTPFALIRAFLPRMLERGSGHIISIGSIAGRLAFPGNGAYSASKFGLRGLHSVLDAELKGTGVRATLIEPAATDTSLWDAIDFERNPGLPERSQMLSVDEVAHTVLFAIEQPPNVAIKYLGIERS